MKSLITGLLLFSCLVVRPQLPKIEDNKLVLDKPVSFEAGSDKLTAEGEEALGQVKAFMTAKEYISLLRVEGHSDNAGNETENQELTGKRALAVCKWLVANGIDCKRLIAVGFGSAKPIADNDTPMGKAANRRMVFALAGMRGKLIGVLPADGDGMVSGDPCN